jgi:predicted unusual protein kinase regulating ubiquinone biosynthesis (AarF/ABC1/UbiB family)
MLKSRYRRIIFFFGRILLGLALWDLIFPYLGLRRLVLRTRPERLRKAAARFRMLAIQMGGVMIKVGQFLSARADVLPEEITRELSGLQDEVPEENFEDIRSLAEMELGDTLAQKFVYFDEKPLAAASLGQVHRARVYVEEPSLTQEGNSVLQLREVVVKVQRPNIELIIKTDLAALSTVGNWLQHYRPIRKRANVPALLAQFSRILYEEIDYNAEGAHAETFAQNFIGISEVKVPRVIWSHTTLRVLTLEDVTGIKITDYESITQAGIAREDVASRLLDTYLKQIFEDGFFHADPHPGNLFVLPLQPRVDGSVPWQLVFVDFGMIGRVAANTRLGLKEMLMGVGTRNADRIIKSYQMLDVLLPEADIGLLKKAEERAFEHFWGKSMSELRNFSPAEAHEFVKEFRELVYTMPFQVPHDLIHLGRTVAILSGMCTGLDPEFNVWTHLAPYAQKLVTSEGGSQGKMLLSEIGVLLQKLAQMPARIDGIIGQVERGELEVRDTRLAERMRHLNQAVQWVAAAIFFTAFLLAGTQFLLGGREVAGYMLWGIGAGIVVFVLFKRSRYS